MSTNTGSRTERLRYFVDWCAEHIDGDEKGEAQLFLDRFFQAFGHDGLLEAGGAAEVRIRKAKEDGGGTAFADCVWKPHVLIEMKKRGVDLQTTYRQAFDYWTRLVPDRPRYVVLSNFDEFWIYDFDNQLDVPVDIVHLDALPDRFGPLAFLFPTHEAPTFGNDHVKVTREAAARLAACFNKLAVREDVGRELAQRFILQMLVALFAEDIGLLEQYTMEKLLDACKQPDDAYDLIGGLFVEMNSAGKTAGGRYKGVDYFNGGIFANPARITLHPDELALLRESANEDWSKVRPEIFGTLFEQTCDQDERHAYGAHFTSAVDIMKIVKPTITDPWEALIDKADTIKRLRELHQRMQHYRVLDPACGSGNFLYLAYRELKRLEKHLLDRLNDLSKKRDDTQLSFSFVTTKQFFGIDINPFAVELAKVTMMLAHKLAIDELHMDEPALPLDNLDQNFRACDALVTPHDSPWAPPPLANAPEHDGHVPTSWPEADVIIGNPPFLDARKTTMEHGDAYAAALEKLYPNITRRCDLCVYWFRRAHDHLPLCTKADPVAGRAGLVGTQNVRNNEAREGGLDHICASGTVVEAVDNQPWSGEANVHVSIANWAKHGDEVQPATLLIPAKKKLWFKVTPQAGPKKRRKRGETPAHKTYDLSYRECALINSALSDEVDVSIASVLTCNRKPKRCFEGIQPGHKGFRITLQEKKRLANEQDVSDVVRQYMNGTALLTGAIYTKPEFLIDFRDKDLLEASAYPKVIDIVRERVLPKWQKNADKEHEKTGKTTGEHQNRLNTWWQLKRARQDLVDAVSPLRRFIACSRVTKRPVFSFLSSKVRPDSSLSCFAFEDDYSFGLLSSNPHWTWFVAKCSKLKSDFRYTPESVFDTFPWPQSPSVKEVDAVAEAGRAVRRVRGEALTKIKGGLRAVYRTLELPGKNPLKNAHAALDAAVLQAYGFSMKQDLLQQLLDLNLAVAAKIDAGEPVTAPGVPPAYPHPAKLVTDDCIQPA